jgi:tRNA pseudouridine55 synthase
MNGLVPVDKPQSWTSHDVVNRWRRLARTRRAGHLGTLDPMATGLLLIVTGNATRLARFFEKQQKTYEAEITLGLLSDTYDAEGTIIETGRALPSSDAILSAASRFRGRILQTPPPVSAKKVGGVPAYKLARRNEPVELASVPVEISSLVITSICGARIHMTVSCSAGTYIRSLAHDLGDRLECGAILTALRRTASGAFHVDGAYTLDALEDLARDDRLAEALVPGQKLLPEFPPVFVDAATETQIRQGRNFRTSPFSVQTEAPFVKALSLSGELVAIGELQLPHLYHPMLVL